VYGVAFSPYWGCFWGVGSGCAEPMERSGGGWLSPRSGHSRANVVLSGRKHTKGTPKNAPEGGWADPGGVRGGEALGGSGSKFSRA